MNLTTYRSTCVQSVMSSLQEEKIDDSLEFLILASDGLWDVFSNEVREVIIAYLTSLFLVVIIFDQYFAGSSCNG